MKVAHDLIREIPTIKYNDFVTRARSLLRDDVFREIYVVDDRNRLLGYLDITAALKVTDTKSNVTAEGFLEEIASVHPETPLEEVALAIRRSLTNSAAVVDRDQTVRGGVLLSELFPILITRHKIRGQVSDYMSRHVVAIDPDEQIRKIYPLIVQSGFVSFPVVRSQEVIGIISRRDILRAGRVRMALKNAADTTVESIMTKPVITISPEASTETAAQLMVQYDISLLPVTEDRRIVGIIDRHDILNALAIKEVNHASER
ncbi:MAG: CBS domain-containing protein [Methanomicrobiaceae archaeon]|uniref:Long-chain-fatty-acid--coa ligase n=1 Tax=hydrocarbon metagenome TaxID=938273 RepID=A0A0W8FFQ1_9ZZZZ|nr:CBS domain-containing protein [Methanomicrobiaceae archaeon]MDD5418812.1 CBS domain-containing protein [Methanomicrobiaceae archaeon]